MTGSRADSFLRMIRRSQRGKLKIYLGYSAGVGKTYQMLLEARRLREDGVDVAVGVVETHGRKETEALLEGLEVIPRRRISYRGIEISEMDLAAILERRPEVVLVDELAHTNAPGSRNSKRYQDVEEILASGIHVISTLNLQHLESLYETVERATGVKVRERIPDRVVADADQVVNVDVTPEDLRRRLEEGKVYTTEKIDTALTHFFRQSNLEQLRELTLRELAAQIDSRRRESVRDEEAPSSPDQVMVCLSSRGPNSEALLRYTSRLAGRLNRNWYAVYVQTSGESPTVIDAATQRMLANTLALAQQLGATVFTYKGDDIVKTILQFAREYRVGHIVIGSTRRKFPFWKRLIGQAGIIERLIMESSGITVVVLDTASILEDGTYAAARYGVNAGLDEEAIPLKVRSPLEDIEVVMWEKTIDKEAAMKELLDACCRNFPEVKDSAWKNLLEREERGGTFAGEDVLIPHARVEGITRPLVAIGVGRAGIEDRVTRRMAKMMFLMISPSDQPESHVKLLAALARMSRDDKWVKTVFTAGDADEVRWMIETWQE